jgi:phosphotriesterase-related protein
MSVIRTVLGDIAAAEFGPCDAHEHLFLDTPLQPGEGFTDPELNLLELRTLAAAGASAVVDWTPIGLGRDPDHLRSLALSTGLHIVAATGVHRDAHYVASDPLRSRTAMDLAELFIEEISIGMDGTDVCAGIIKAGASYHHVSPFERRIMEAAAQAQVATGAPLCVHTEHGTHGGPLVELLTGLGVPGDRIVLAHLDRNPDVGEHAETAQSGAWLGLDGPGRAKYWPDSAVIGLIESLAERGLADRILVGGDVGRAAMLRAYGGGPGLDYVFARFRPRLARELGEELADTIFIKNPGNDGRLNLRAVWPVTRRRSRTGRGSRCGSSRRAGRRP